MLITLRRYIIAGLLVWVPLGITVFVIKLLLDLIDRLEFLLPPPWRPEVVFGFDIPGLGAALGTLIVLLTGAIAANLIGRRLVAAWDHFLARIPLVRNVYPPVKQVMETLLNAGGLSFREVLLVEFPRKGIWRLGFQTGNPSPEIKGKVERDLITVFLPSTPNPTSGFVVFLPREDTITLDMPVDVAMKLIMSLGVLSPSDPANVAVEDKPL